MTLMKVIHVQYVSMWNQLAQSKSYTLVRVKLSSLLYSLCSTYMLSHVHVQTHMHRHTHTKRKRFDKNILIYINKLFKLLVCYISYFLFAVLKHCTKERHKHRNKERNDMFWFIAQGYRSPE